MPDRQSPLEGVLPVSFCQGTVCIAEATPSMMAEAQAWDGHQAELERTLSHWSGAATVSSEAFAEKGVGFAQIGPSRYFLWGAVPPDIDIGVGTCVDLSHARVVLVLTGDHARDLLVRAVPLDVRDCAFDVGHMVSTPLHHIPVLLARPTLTQWVLIVPRSYARSMVNHLQHVSDVFSAA